VNPAEAMEAAERRSVAWARRASDVLVIVLAFALPLSIAASEITLGLLIVAWLVSRPWTRAQAPGVRPLAWATVALAAAWILSSLTSGVIVASLIKARKLYSIVIVFIVADRVRDATRARRVVDAVFAAGLVTSAIGVVKFLIVHARGGWDQPLVGVFSNGMTTGNVLTALTVAALAVTLFASGRERHAWLDRGSLVVFLGTLFATFRRGSYLGWLAASLALVAQRRARWLPLVPLAAVLALALEPHEAAHRATSIVAHSDPTSTGRISLWKSGWAAFQAKPITGWGLEDATALIERYRRPDATFHAGHFHNNWVQIAVTTGALGALAYAVWMGLAGYFLFLAFRKTRSPYAAAGWGVWLAFQVFGLFDWAFGDAEVANQLFLWIGLALASAAR
jgi:O-antigen ligase